MELFLPGWLVGARAVESLAGARLISPYPLSTALVGAIWSDKSRSFSCTLQSDFSYSTKPNIAAVRKPFIVKNYLWGKALVQS